MKNDRCEERERPVKAASRALPESGRAPGPEQGGRPWAQRERSLSPETEARSPGWAWRRPRGQSRREDSREPLTKRIPPVTELPRLVVQRLALRERH